MSTKDILERLSRTPPARPSARMAPSRPTRPEEAPAEEKQSTRVAGGIIRRPRPSDPAAENRATPSAPPAPVETTVRTKTVLRRPGAESLARRAEAPAAPVAAPPPPVVEVPPPPVVVEAPPSPPVTEPPRPKAVEAPAPAPAPPRAVEIAPAPEPVVVAEPTPPAAPTPEPPRLERPRPVDLTPEPQSPGAAATARRGLPRLGGGDRPAGAFPGLGSAVVSPPPGYDPTDVAGNRRRAQEAARRTSDAAPPSVSDPSRKPVWRDETSPDRSEAPRDEFRDRGRPKGKGKRRQAADTSLMDDAARRRRSRKRGGPLKVSPKAAAHKRRVEVHGTISVANLAHAMSVKASQVIKHLISMGQMATMNDELDLETAQLVAEEFEFEAVDASFSEEDHLIDVEEEEDDPGQVTRPPVVTIMGHVDHGKTTLLDAIRKTNVAAGEAGGITQHTSAYQVERGGHKITFIDTPGHAAFTAMRARGAQVTDIVVLVVAAEDGVMPQTVEALNHAKAAGVQIIVAVNKIDKPGANPEKIKQALLEHELVAEEYGGDTIFVPVSALKGTGIQDLLDAINLVAEVGEYTANPDRHAEGTVLEARLERGRGPVANVLVQKGTLKQGDRVVMGTTWGRVRAMTDHNGKRLNSAGPSTPVEIIGLEDVPSAGDNFVVVANDKDAKALAEHRKEEARKAELAESSGRRVTLEELLKQRTEGEKLVLNLIVKTDVGGTLEAMRGAVKAIHVDGTEVKLLHSAVGAISESDIMLAHTYGAVVIGFNVRPDGKARRTADEYGVEVRTYNVIYEALEDIEKALKGMLAPTFQDKVQGVAEIREIFNVPKVGTIAGCRVVEGTVARSHQVRLLRDGKIIWTGRLASLRRFKDDVREVAEGYECGMHLDGFNDIKAGDVIETFSQEQVPAT